MKRVNVPMPTDLAQIGGPEGLFTFMRERHQAYLRKSSGLPRPWTSDPIIHKYRFTNVFRELDRTTIWFKENIRDKYANGPEAMFAIAVFRWFNRIETGETLFLKTDAFERYLESGDVSPMRDALMDLQPGGPYVTGAHMVYAVPGMPLHEGVLFSIQKFTDREENRMNSRAMAELMFAGQGDVTLEETWNWMTNSFFGLGSFLAYELVTDLRHTVLLNQAPDIYSWANPGPGSTRGLNRVFGRPYTSRPRRDSLVEEMRYLLQLTKGDNASKYNYWPNNSEYPELEMRDVEHSLCEYDKYLRVANGDGYPRGVYR